MKKQVVIITGMSGSGKSTAAKTLEDAGFFCVDNLPIDLLPKLLEITDTRGEEFDRLALVIDLRQREFFPRYDSILGALELGGAPMQILFLDARDEVIVRRYSETRRQHPLALEGNVLDGIAKEREELRRIKEKADRVVDTSDMTVHQLRDEVRKLFGNPSNGALRIVINSFGFGRGIPVDSDLVLDVRFLPNPHFVAELREQEGRDPAVRDWIESHKTTRDFRKKLEDLLIFLLPLYIKEGKQYLTISVGCTGGRHRSPAVAERVAEFLQAIGYGKVEVRHRELRSRR
jgi:UPF0042 nucleotide-binding protein